MEFEGAYGETALLSHVCVWRTRWCVVVGVVCLLVWRCFFLWRRVVVAVVTWRQPVGGVWWSGGVCGTLTPRCMCVCGLACCSPLDVLTILQAVSGAPMGIDGGGVHACGSLHGAGMCMMQMCVCVCVWKTNNNLKYPLCDSDVDGDDASVTGGGGGCRCVCVRTGGGGPRGNVMKQNLRKIPHISSVLT